MTIKSDMKINMMQQKIKNTEINMNRLTDLRDRLLDNVKQESQYSTMSTQNGMKTMGVESQARHNAYAMGIKEANERFDVTREQYWREAGDLQM